VATGGTALVPALPGVNRKIAVTAHDVLAGKVAIGPGNVLIVGGGMVGCEVADMLADQGDNQTLGGTAVIILEMLPNIGLDMQPESRMLLMPRLRERGIRIITSATVKEIVEDGIIFMKDGREEAIHEMNFIILAIGTKSFDELSGKIKDKVSEVYVIGDAKQPRKVLQAIAEGAEVGRKI
jgi:pyruvate/2-oxoglutarate dehydrogenase complex dihydrolipoamide dehydrogenase (E3) component